ncbi:hypothetical protein [Pseudomonas fluorescens]|uniref:hypothetical protein n=1 Tax=Pseudomonas fluorescens TaxID=294 RepID=UPI001A9FD494|nr:hypothetical protein [Pseudomonas fluorescens]QTD31420.1 hypothetical protein JZM58_19210 [Pseudomonas fluorescens]
MRNATDRFYKAFTTRGRLGCDSTCDQQRINPRILVLEIRDKDRVDDPPLGWLVVEREEKYERDPLNGQVCDASIRLSYQRITATCSSYESDAGQFDGSYSRCFNTVSLTSSSVTNGSVFLGLPGLYGQRIGNYLMNVIVEWVQQWPDTAVNPIELLMGQARGDNKARRNRFYEQFGIHFDYRDAGRREGRSRPMHVRELSVVETWKNNIFEHKMIDHLTERLDAVESAQMNFEARNRAYTFLSEEQAKAEATPLRWAFGRHFRQSVERIVIGLVLTVCISLIWFNTK